MENENLMKLQHFFIADMKLKKEMYEMAPQSLGQFADNESVEKYSDRLNDSLMYIFSELKCICSDVFGCDSNVYSKVNLLEYQLKNEFYSCGYDLDKLKKFYTSRVSDMSLEFLDKVKHECVGYSGCWTSSANDANTLNECLHFIHSYVMNNDQILKSIPLIKNKENQFGFNINIRGTESSVFNNLYENFPLDLDVGYTDMVAINEKKLIMMVRDRGHALSVEVTLDGDNARVEYFVPKLCNVDMVNALPGVNKVNKESTGATGVFETPINNLSEMVIGFISKVPMDSDMVYEPIM